MNWNNVRLQICLTMGCNFNCAHCHSLCSPSRMKEKMTPDDVLKILSEYSARGGRIGIKFSGGEPTLNMPALMAGIAYCTIHGIPSTLATNAWWGKNKALEYLAAFEGAGLTTLLTTFDTFHAAFHPWQDVKNILDYLPYSNVGMAPIFVTRELGEKYKSDILGIVGSKDYDYFINHAGIGFAVSNGRAQNIKKDWNKVELVCPFTTNWRQMMPFVSIMPGNKISLNCVHNKGHIFEYEGDWTIAVDRVLDVYMEKQRKYGLMLSELSKKENVFCDGCDVCSYITDVLNGSFDGVMAKLVTGGEVNGTESR